MVNGHVDKTVSGLDYGAGIRVLNGLNAVYVYTNDMSENGLIKTAKAAADAIEKAKKTNCKQFQVIEHSNINPIKVQPSEVKNKEKRDLLRRLLTLHSIIVIKSCKPEADIWTILRIFSS